MKVTYSLLITSLFLFVSCSTQLDSKDEAIEFLESHYFSDDDANIGSRNSSGTIKSGFSIKFENCKAIISDREEPLDYTIREIKEDHNWIGMPMFKGAGFIVKICGSERYAYGGCISCYLSSGEFNDISLQVKGDYVSAFMMEKFGGITDKSDVERCTESQEVDVENLFEGLDEAIEEEKRKKEAAEEEKKAQEEAERLVEEQARIKAEEEMLLQQDLLSDTFISNLEGHIETYPIAMTLHLSRIYDADSLPTKEYNVTGNYSYTSNTGSEIDFAGRWNNMTKEMVLNIDWDDGPETFDGKFDYNSSYTGNWEVVRKDGTTTRLFDLYPQRVMGE